MAVTSVAEVLRAARIDPLDARVLLQAVLGVSPAYLAAHPEHAVASDQRDRYLALVARRAAGEPVAYLTGEREFFSLNFRVPDPVIMESFDAPQDSVGITVDGNITHPQRAFSE